MSIDTTKKIIITGGPGYGKTTIIKALEAKDYKVQHEFGREIIQHALETGGDKTPWQDVVGFSEEVLKGRIQQYHQASEHTLSFLDRGIPDIIAFLRKDKVEISPIYEVATETYRYSPIVFVTPPWKEIFVQDEERKEEYNLSVEIHEFIEDTYRSLGYTIVEIPKYSVEERVAFIINYLEQETL